MAIVDINNSNCCIHVLLISTIELSISTMYVQYLCRQFQLSTSIIHEQNNTNCRYLQLVLLISTIPIVDMNNVRTLLISTISIATIPIVDINKSCPLQISIIRIVDIVVTKPQIWNMMTNWISRFCKSTCTLLSYLCGRTQHVRFWLSPLLFAFCV